MDLFSREERMKGCICLDIDGTTTADPHFVPERVLECLRFLHGKGWHFAFVTGRTFAFGLKTLEKVDFPFFFGVQNGSDLLLMPEKKVLSRAYLPSNIVTQIEEITKDTPEDFLVYSGPEEGDFCYYRKENFSPLFLEHIEIIKKFSKEPWKEVREFAFSKEQRFPLIKYLGTEKNMRALYDKIKNIPGIRVACIKDPVSEGVYINLITALDALKGNCLHRIRKYFPEGALVIAAGDDYNDVSMLKEADVAIVMSNAPPALLPLADIVARSAKDLGIIDALLEATKEKE